MNFIFWWLKKQEEARGAIFAQSYILPCPFSHELLKTDQVLGSQAKSSDVAQYLQSINPAFLMCLTNVTHNKSHEQLLEWPWQQTE